MGSSLLQNWLGVYVSYLRMIVKLLVGLSINFLTDTVQLGIDRPDHVVKLGECDILPGNQHLN